MLTSPGGEKKILNLARSRPEWNFGEELGLPCDCKWSGVCLLRLQSLPVLLERSSNQDTDGENGAGGGFIILGLSLGVCLPLEYLYMRTIGIDRFFLTDTDFNRFSNSKPCRYRYQFSTINIKPIPIPIFQEIPINTDYRR